MDVRTESGKLSSQQADLSDLADVYDTEIQPDAFHESMVAQRWTASQRRSTSSKVLYMAKEALMVPGTPKMSMTGCAQ